MKKKKRGKSGPKVKIKDAHRACWNVTGEHWDWVKSESERLCLSESEFVRTVFDSIKIMGVRYSVDSKAS